MADLAVSPLPIEEEESNNFFELLPGKVLDFQVNHPVQVRLRLPLIGYETGKYIMLKYPSTSDNFNDVLIEGNVAIIRYLLEGDKGCCFAFKATIRNITQSPEKLIYLNYPKKIENRQLRAHQRITTHLPAAISLNAPDQSNIELNGIIVDLSLKGCGFTFKASSGIVSVKQREIFVCVTHYATGEMRIPARVCNSRNEKGRVNVGIQFNEGDQQVATLLEQLFIDTSIL
ncbi:PilZ domain-containing protein [Thalassotalea sp. 1_MG-2023]|uniref:flagellar brake protein n=1 Tax=Thalassotalea sp. 1_MG-2023 TaxID=3062680 RepID=UPI0026E48D73|nr:PilZ domain-containing protein [Thalassotalea sp. 1_MG-2023]MDO6426597.1 PilZ domain-containing protein [Thalassotalea sp. 1_MG-2023]